MVSSAESVSSDSLVTNVSMTQLVESERYLEDRARLEDVLHTDPSVINVGDEEGLTALHLAALSGNVAALELFLSSQAADVDQTDQSGHSALHWAAVCHRIDCVRLLCQHGAQADLRDHEGAGALHYAVQADWADLVGALLEGGAGLELRDGLGRTPLMWAAACDSVTSLLLLLEAGTEVAARDGQSLTALHSGAARGSERCVGQILDRHPALVDIQDTEGASPLFYAASSGQLGCVRLLLERSAEVTLRDRLGRTVLACAVASNNTQIMETLQAAGADLLATTCEGDTILHLATGKHLLEMVSWILHNAPSLVNRQNKVGVTPIHLATSLNNVRKVLLVTLRQSNMKYSRICKLLLDFHCHCNPVMKYGRRRRFAMMTPVDIAMAKNYIGCCKLLQLHGGVKWSSLQRQRSQSEQLVRVMSAPSLR